MPTGSVEGHNTSLCFLKQHLFLQKLSMHINWQLQLKHVDENVICVGQVDRRFFTPHYLHDINRIPFSIQLNISVILIFPLLK
jgi:hypothetical protein